MLRLVLVVRRWLFTTDFSGDGAVYIITDRRQQPALPSSQVEPSGQQTFKDFGWQQVDDRERRLTCHTVILVDLYIYT